MSGRCLFSLYRLLGGDLRFEQPTTPSDTAAVHSRSTTLTTTSAIGTFSFTLTTAPNTTATGTKVVTNGAFNITF
jgi:hypothetical protein